MAQDAADGDAVVVESARRHFPAREVARGRCVEIELAGFDQGHDAEGRDPLAERGDLKARASGLRHTPRIVPPTSATVHTMSGSSVSRMKRDIEIRPHPPDTRS
jgi:hypothetical protein